MSESASRVAVVVQARMTSRRLPGKVQLPLAGTPAILRMMERVGRVSRAHLRAVATSTDRSDDSLVEICRGHDIAVARGPLDDVLARFLLAVPQEFDTVVRLTADCPLVDPDLVDRHIEIFQRERPAIDYVTNAVKRTYPDGLDVEVVSRELLVRAEREATAPFDREHVLSWARDNARVLPVTQPADLSALRWTLDTPQDYEAISTIYDTLYPQHPGFGSDDVYGLLVRRPELIRVEGRESLTPRERGTWVTRIAEHLASGSL